MVSAFVSRENGFGWKPLKLVDSFIVAKKVQKIDMRKF